jgi:hypothetical protein
MTRPDDEDEDKDMTRFEALRIQNGVLARRWVTRLHCHPYRREEKDLQRPL